MVAEIAVRYVNSEVLRGGLGARIYERAPEQCRDHKPSPVKEIFRHCSGALSTRMTPNQRKKTKGQIYIS